MTTRPEPLPIEISHVSGDREAMVLRLPSGSFLVAYMVGGIARPKADAFGTFEHADAVAGAFAHGANYGIPVPSTARSSTA